MFIVNVNQPRIIMLIGLPASGKSTFRESLVNSDYYLYNNCFILSSDDVIEQFAKEKSLTYNEAWAQIDKDALEKDLLTSARVAVNYKFDIIVDRTNLTVKSRAKFLSLVTPDYNKIAHTFRIDEKIRKERDNRPGKTIPTKTISKMMKSYQHPTFSEFNTIVNEVQ